MSEVENKPHCREQGLYAHHIKQWKDELASGVMTKNITPDTVFPLPTVYLTEVKSK
jgi:hypothetical protein